MFDVLTTAPKCHLPPALLSRAEQRSQFLAHPRLGTVRQQWRRRRAQRRQLINVESSSSFEERESFPIFLTTQPPPPPFDFPQRHGSVAAATKRGADPSIVGRVNNLRRVPVVLVNAEGHHLHLALHVDRLPRVGRGKRLTVIKSALQNTRQQTKPTAASRNGDNHRSLTR